MSLKYLLTRGNISEVLKVAATNWTSDRLRGYKSLSLHKLCISIKMVNSFTVVKVVSFEAGNILTSKNRNSKQ